MAHPDEREGNGWFINVSGALGLALMLFLVASCTHAIVCEIGEVGDPHRIEPSDVPVPPDGYRVLNTSGGCGSGSKPVDCGLTVVIDTPDDVAPTAAARALTALAESAGWHPCDPQEGLCGEGRSVRTLPGDGEGVVEVRYHHQRADDVPLCGGR